MPDSDKLVSAEGRMPSPAAEIPSESGSTTPAPLASVADLSPTIPLGRSTESTRDAPLDPSELDRSINEISQLLGWGLRPDLLGLVASNAAGDGLTSVIRYYGQVDRPQETLRCHTTIDPQWSLASYCREHPQVVYSTNLTNEVRFRDRLLLEQGMSTALAAPLMRGDNWRGTLFVATKQPREFGVGDAVFLNSVACLLADSFAHAIAAPSHTELIAATDDQLDRLRWLVVSIDPHGKIIGANQACEKSVGVARNDLRGHDFFERLIAVGDRDRMRETLKLALAGTEAPAELSALGSSRGQSKQIDWRFKTSRRPAGDESRLFAIGSDVTARCELYRLLQASHEESLASAKRLSAPRGAERRQHPRTAFPHTQLIAASCDGRLPENTEFREVRCRDISAEGFSFLWPTPWRPDELLVTFDSGRQFAHLLAIVAHNTRIDIDGLNEYVVGCRFVGRILE